MVEGGREVGLYFVFFIFAWAYLFIKNKFVLFVVLALSVPEEIPVYRK